MAIPTGSTHTTPAERGNALFERAPLAVVDPPTFGEVKTAVERAFAATGVSGFLKTLQSKGLRIREFENVLQAGALGPQTAVEFARLSHGDQGQIRELYLASLERVDMGLRNKFFKLYAYY